MATTKEAFIAWIRGNEYALNLSISIGILVAWVHLSALPIRFFISPFGAPLRRYIHVNMAANNFLPLTLYGLDFLLPALFLISLLFKPLKKCQLFFFRHG